MSISWRYGAVAAPAGSPGHAVPAALRAEVRELHRRDLEPGGASVSHATRPGLPVAGLPGMVAGYRLDGYVGQGGRAVVYLARDERLQRRVALKVMMPELARDTGFRTRMISESRAAAALGHPHIVPVFQADETDGTLYAAMRYVTGCSAGMTRFRSARPGGSSPKSHRRWMPRTRTA
jgi:serine/threonine protein kinase